jgi:HD superfamily phosphodiesterase
MRTDREVLRNGRKGGEKIALREDEQGAAEKEEIPGKRKKIASPITARGSAGTDIVNTHRGKKRGSAEALPHIDRQ